MAPRAETYVSPVFALNRGTEVAVRRRRKRRIPMKQNSTWAKRALNGAIVGTALVGLACSNAPKRVSYDPTTNPDEVVAGLETAINQGYAMQVDVLAQDDFTAGRNELEQAREQMREGKSQERVLKALGYSRAYIDRAIRKADNRRPKLEGVLASRQAALEAGARKFPRTRDELADIDNNVRNVVKDDTLSPRKFSDLQSQYMDLELAAIQSQHLTDARARIEGAKRKNAAKFTPKTLNRAETDLRNAENMIASRRHEPVAFKPAVDRVNSSSILLVDVSQKVRSGKAVLPEDVALKLVFQERGIGRMSERLQSMQTQSEQTSEVLSVQEQELKKARETQALERALAQARKEFSREEADVYRDGNRLLIRLKSMNFPTGRADVPAASLALLEKVRNVTEELEPSQVVVEGHTDSTGSASVNGQLSQKRAEAVAGFLENGGIDSDKIQAIGYGFKKPIANNKSKEGRSQNRRVDLIITPTIPQTATTSM
jgi:outer membrane protein OmpA-like peptidoglycan-associated protein/transcriptional regulator with XRE-family HTH domain